MKRWSRRTWITSMGVAAFGVPAFKPAYQFGEKQVPPTKGLLPLLEYEPKSMLHVQESRIEKSRFPVIDIHTHLTWTPDYSDEAPEGGKARPTATPSELLEVMDRRGIQILVNISRCVFHSIVHRSLFEIRHRLFW